MRISGFAIAAVVGLTITVYSCVNEEVSLPGYAVGDDDFALHGPSGAPPPPPPPPSPCLIQGTQRLAEVDYSLPYQLDVGIPDFEISGDGQKVFYIHNRIAHNLIDVDGEDDLYMLDIVEGQATEMLMETSGYAPELADYPPPNTMWGFRFATRVFSADKNWFVYQSPDVSNGQVDLYAVSATMQQGAAPILLAQDIEGAFAISPDSGKVYFQKRSGQIELHSVPIGGGSSTFLMNPIVDDGIRYLQPSADGQRVLYAAALGPFMTLYSASIAGASSTYLAGGIAAGDLWSISTYQVELTNGDSRTLVRLLDDGSQMFSTSVSGGSRIDFSGVARANGDTAFKMTPSKAEAVLVAGESDGAGASWENVHIANPLNGVLTNVSNILAPPIANRSNEIKDFEIAAGGQSVVYHAKVWGSGAYTYTLYSVRLSDGLKNTLYQAPGAGGSFAITPDGQSVVFFAANSAHSVPINGGAVTELYTLAYPARNFQLVSDQAVVYEADFDSDGRYDLVHKSLSDGLETTVTHPDLTANDEIDSVKLTSDHSTVVFSSANGTIERSKLWATCLPAAP